MTTSLNELFNISQNSKVLFIYPHPDDETFANANLISLLVTKKIKTKIVCLTKGEASTLRFGIGDNDLVAAREIEFRHVMEYLKVSNYEILDLPDGKLELLSNLDKLVAQIIVGYNPTHVITYEPDGIYGHPDHIALTKIVVSKKNISNYQLIYSTVSQKYKSSKDALAMAKEPSKIKPMKANTILYLSLIDYIHKLKAIRVYKSQFTMQSNLLQNLIKMLLLRYEYYCV